MNPKYRRKSIQELIDESFVPADLYSSNPAEIEAMLDAAGGEPLAEDQIARILKKAAGDLPIGRRIDDESSWCEDALNDQERELLALHRNEGKELPPEVADKLRQLREKAKADQEMESDDLEA